MSAPAAAAPSTSAALMAMPSAKTPMIELTDVTMIYHLGKMDVPALRGVSLTITAGEWVAVMGPSGGGKSSLMNVIGCLDTPTSGSYRLNGIEVTGMNDDALAELRSRRIGFVFQSHNLLPRTTALKQVMLPMQYARNGRRIGFAEREKRSRAALEMVGLGERLAHRPSELSGGQSQRVAIARALINGPDILLADEPTGNLDSISGDEVMDVFARLHKERGLTIVMVTHEEDIAAHAGRIIRLKDGRIISDDVVGGAIASDGAT